MEINSTSLRQRSSAKMSDETHAKSSQRKTRASGSFPLGVPTKELKNEGGFPKSQSVRDFIMFGLL